MDIDLARTFLAVVQTGSFLDAAEKVHVSQSTVSARIRSLEQQLGQSVFQRGKAGATLTPAGQRFERHALALVRTWTQAKLDASLPADYDTSLEIGALPSLWDDFLIHAIPDLLVSQPGVAIKASFASTEQLNMQLQEGILDLAVLYQPRNMLGLIAKQLFEDEFVLVSSDLAGADDPFGFGFLFVDWGPDFRSDFLRAFPDLATPRLTLAIGTLGLQYLFGRPSSGYFPLRIVKEHIRCGKLRLVEEAPRFAYEAHVVLNEAQSDGLAGDVARHIQLASRRFRTKK